MQEPDEQDVPVPGVSSAGATSWRAARHSVIRGMMGPLGEAGVQNSMQFSTAGFFLLFFGYHWGLGRIFKKYLFRFSFNWVFFKKIF